MKQERKAPTLIRSEGYWTGQFRAMASPCQILTTIESEAEAHALVKRCATEAWRVEDKFSRYQNNTIIARINSAAGAKVEVDDETAGLINFAFMLFDLSQGMFDISSGVLGKAWKFDGSDKLPEPASVEALLGHVGLEKINWDAPYIQLPAGMQIDFGGIGKEYAVDLAAQLVIDNHLTNVLVNFGGDLRAMSNTNDKHTWHVGIEAQNTRIEISAGGLATSGDAHRYLQKDGKRYSHILNPNNGWPVEDAPGSVTVLADTCTQAGMLATLASLHGASAEAFLAEQNVRCWITR